MTVEAVKEFGLSRKDASRAKNMFALGLLSWMYGRPTESTISFLERRFAKAPDIRDANVTAFNAGWYFGETTEAFVVQYEIKPAPMTRRHLPQHHRQPGAGLRPDRRAPPSPGCRCSSGPTRSPRPPTSCTSSASTSGSASPRSRPRTRSPASAPPSARRSAARSASPPPPARASRSKAETIGLGVMMELPLLVVDVQRGGPSTGLPTKTEQADLLQAMFGRNGESPVPVIAPQSPGRLLRRRRSRPPGSRSPTARRWCCSPTAMLANGSEPWQIPEVADLPVIDPAFATETNHEDAQGQRPSSGPTCATRRPSPARGRCPARRGSSTASAAWRRARGTATSPTTPPTTTSWSAPAPPRWTGSPATSRRWRSTTPPARRRVLVLGWGSTYGPIGARSARSATPATTSPRRTCGTSTRSRRTSATCSSATTRCMVPEMNLGQLSMLLRGEVPRRRRRLQPRARPAAASRRARRRHHRPDQPRPSRSVEPHRPEEVVR